jgi:hypothetical protein
MVHPLHTWCIRDGSEYFGLGSLYNGNVGFAGAAPEFYAVCPYWLDDCFVEE